MLLHTFVVSSLCAAKIVLTMSNLAGSRCYCDRPVVMKTIWGGRNAGRRMEACVAGDCYYEVWIDEPLNTRARGALEELMQKNKDLHESYHKKMERVRARQVKRRGAIWAQLQLIHNELSASDSSEEDEVF